MISIDGSTGEGGGQILRTSLSLSLITGQPFTLFNVRANRSRPGLQPQHLMAVTAAARIGHARTTGAELQSQRLEFFPGPVTGGHYEFLLRTAGSSSLVLQTVLPALLLADDPSHLVVTGGTYNPFAPPFDFLQRTFAPQLCRLGPQVSLRLQRAGFYPRGGGKVIAEVVPSGPLAWWELFERGALRQQRVQAFVAGLDRTIAQRECRTIQELSGWPDHRFESFELDPRQGPGNVVLLELEYEHVTEIISAVGERGRTAERVAEAAWAEASRYLATPAPVGEHLADQLLLPLAIAASQSGTGGRFRTGPLSLHTTTNMDLIRRFVDVRFETESCDDGTVIVQVVPG